MSRKSVRHLTVARPITLGQSPPDVARLFDAMSTCDGDCASGKGEECDCGAKEFAAKFGREWRTHRE